MSQVELPTNGKTLVVTIVPKDANSQTTEFPQGFNVTYTLDDPSEIDVTEYEVGNKLIRKFTPRSTATTSTVNLTVQVTFTDPSTSEVTNLSKSLQIDLVNNKATSFEIETLHS